MSRPTVGGVEWDDLARGIVAGLLEREVRDRGSLGRWIGVGLMVLGLVGTIAFGGFLRGVSILSILVGLIVVLVVLLLRALALAAIRRFATPVSLAEKRDEIDRAAERADLPTGPISIVRFLWRLRRGVGTEVRRLGDVVDDLQAELLATEPAAAVDPAADLPAIEPSNGEEPV